MSDSSRGETDALSLLADLISHVVRAGFEDWSIVDQICDTAASSESCAVQANISLTNELGADTSEHRLLRVARLWAIMLRNCGQEFAQYNASPASGFLDAVEGVISRNFDSGASQRFLRVLGAAVYDIARTDPMHPYAILWVQVKHPGQPSLGLRIPETDALLRPTPVTSSANSNQALSKRSSNSIQQPSASAPASPPPPPPISIQQADMPSLSWDPYSNLRKQRLTAEDPSRPRYRKDINFDSRAPPESSAEKEKEKVKAGFRLPALTSSSPFTPGSSSSGTSELLSTPYSATSSGPESPGVTVLPSNEKPRKRSFRRSMVDSLRSSLDKVLVKDSSSGEATSGAFGDGGGGDDIVESPDSTPELELVLPSFPTRRMSYASISSALPPLTSSSNPTTSSSSDIFSLVHTGLDMGITLNMSISDLCAHIRASPSANESRIMNLIWNKEQSGVKHEFLLVKVVSPNTNTSGGPGAEGRPRLTSLTTWVRLDRAARKGYRGFRSLHLRSSSAIFPANDTAMVSGKRDVLTGETSRMQANIEFLAPPSLADLETLLTVIGEESADYDLFKENCYFFCSVIQQIMSELHQGRVAYGKPLHTTLGADARRRITLRLRQYSIPWTFPNM